MAKRYDTVGIWPLDEAAKRYPGAGGAGLPAFLLHIGFTEHRLETVMWQGQPYTSTHWIYEYMRSARQEQEDVNEQEDIDIPASPIYVPPSDAEDDVNSDNDTLTTNDFYEPVLDHNDEPLSIDADPLAEADAANSTNASENTDQDEDARPGGVIADFSYTIEEGHATGSASDTAPMLAWLKPEHPGLYWLVRRWRVDGAGTADIAEEAGVSEATINRYFQIAQDIYSHELHVYRKHTWGEGAGLSITADATPIARRTQRNQDTRAQILQAIDDLTQARGRAPLFNELLMQLGWTSRHKLQDHLKALREEGRVVNCKGWARP